MSKMARNKGANFERSVIAELREIMGDMVIPRDLRRNLSQYQEVDLCDIELEPFAIECKRYAKGNWYQKDWLEQCNRAAAKINLIPVLIWKYDRLPIRVTMPIYAVNSEWAVNGQVDQYSWPVEGNAMLPVTFTTLEDACSVMREWLV
jgi:Holliday junction resolvase